MAEPERKEASVRIELIGLLLLGVVLGQIGFAAIYRLDRWMTWRVPRTVRWAPWWRKDV